MPHACLSRNWLEPLALRVVAGVLLLFVAACGQSSSTKTRDASDDRPADSPPSHGSDLAAQESPRLDASLADTLAVSVDASAQDAGRSLDSSSQPDGVDASSRDVDRQNDGRSLDGSSQVDGSLDTTADMALDAPIDSSPDVAFADIGESTGDSRPQDSAPGDAGVSCTKATDCTSGFCVRGVCCDRACTGPCEICPSAGASGIGTCQPVPAGQDPFNTCPDEGAATCGNSGFCDGTGACAKYPAGTICRTALCMGSVLTHASVCDGNGSCVAAVSTSCAPYSCASDGTRCNDG